MRVSFQWQARKSHNQLEARVMNLMKTANSNDKLGKNDNEFETID